MSDVCFQNGLYGSPDQSDERKAVAGRTAKTGTGAESGKTEATKEKGRKEKTIKKKKAKKKPVKKKVKKKRTKK